jgi:hypothetical protein
MPFIPESRKLSQENLKFEASLSYIGDPVSKIKIGSVKLWGAGGKENNKCWGKCGKTRIFVHC